MSVGRPGRSTCCGLMPHGDFPSWLWVLRHPGKTLTLFSQEKGWQTAGRRRQLTMQEAGLRRRLRGPPRGLPHSHPAPLTKQPGLGLEAGRCVKPGRRRGPVEPPHPLPLQLLTASWCGRCGRPVGSSTHGPRNCPGPSHCAPRYTPKRTENRDPSHNVFVHVHSSTMHDGQRCHSPGSIRDRWSSSCGLSRRWHHR